jgi:hypothetical protein
MNVGPSIIADHAHIWSDNVISMVKAVADQNEHFQRMRMAVTSLAPDSAGGSASSAVQP